MRFILIKAQTDDKADSDTHTDKDTGDNSPYGLILQMNLFGGIKWRDEIKEFIGNEHKDNTDKSCNTCIRNICQDGINIHDHFPSVKVLTLVSIRATRSSMASILISSLSLYFS